ncbi:hypothetical protein ACFFX0_25815 [Citricoccus parietis]|uniref:Uncharacterized protein n=1 Tax=Citricoccus parietis TaxID=592307 RepID=A0ABV5G643_9MICC
MAPGSRRRKISTSVFTSVPALSCMAPLGRRTAPTRSAYRANSRRAEARWASIVQVEVITATYPPGAVSRRDLAMK